MGKRGNSKKQSPALTSGFRNKPMTLREEITGKKQFGVGGSTNVKTKLKMEHLQNLAVWAGGEGSIPSLGAFLGHRLATCGEAAGTPLDQSLFPCNRCETILQPGYNCTVRIEKNRDKVHRSRKKSNTPIQNNVIYTCHFCSTRNCRRGTPKGHMKEILASKPNPISEPKPFSATEQISVSSKLATKCCSKVDKKMDEMTPSKDIAPLESKPDISNVNFLTEAVENSPATPTERALPLLSLGKKRKKSGTGSNKQVETKNETGTMDSEKKQGGSSRKRRKSWSSLKQIAEENERKNSSNITNLTIPFIV